MSLTVQPSAWPTAFTSGSGIGARPRDALADAGLALEARGRVLRHQRQLRQLAR